MGFAVVGAIGALVGTLVGGMCIASMINLAAGAMAMMAEKQTAKMADEEMKRLEEEFKIIEERTKTDVMSYEIQKEAIEFYIRALESAIRIANQYAKTYDSVGMMFGSAMAVGAMEIMFAMLQKPPNMKKIMCAGINIASGGVGMGLAKKASGIAKGMASDFEDQKEKLERIRDLYDKHFGQQGGLSQYAMNSGVEKGVNTATNKPINNNKPLGTVTSATSSSISNKMIEQPKPEGGVESNGCVDSNGIIQDDCSCKANNSCLNVSSPPELNDTKIGRNLTDSIELDKSLTEANSIMAGDLSVSELDGNSLASRFNKVQKVNKKLADQLNKKFKNELERANVEIKYPDDKMLASYINKVMPPSKRVGGANKFMRRFLGDVDMDDIKDTQRKLDEGFNDESRAVATTPYYESNFTQAQAQAQIRPSTITQHKLDGINLQQEQSESDDTDSNFNGEADQLYKLTDEQRNSTGSLWAMLTKRYHIILKQKRLGDHK